MVAKIIFLIHKNFYEYKNNIEALILFISLFSYQFENKEEKKKVAVRSVRKYYFFKVPQRNRKEEY